MLLINDDCLNALKDIPSCSVDSMITDPPGGIAFMGKSWDKDKGGRDEWIEWLAEIMVECKRVLKPGGHAFVWALPRTSHWTATAIEDAGFDIRDIVVQIFGQGFPKSQNIGKAIDKAAGVEREVVGKSPSYRPNHNNREVSITTPSGNCTTTKPATPEAKQWDGYGTGLKPSNEHWILCRKPISEKTIAKNVLKHGCGGLNIDGSRIEISEKLPNYKSKTRPSKNVNMGGGVAVGGHENSVRHNPQGRFPANTIVDESAVAVLDLQSGVLKSGKIEKHHILAQKSWKQSSGETTGLESYGDSGGASRFFYCAKASKVDKGKENSHPTVKNTKLMSYLIKLITPPNGIVLDPFMGSGSTGVAAIREGFEFIGIEKELEYYEIAKTRIEEAAHS